MFFLCFFFTDLCQTNYLKIYQTDVHQICIFGRTMAVDGPFELVLRSPAYPENEIQPQN